MFPNPYGSLYPEWINPPERRPVETWKPLADLLSSELGALGLAEEMVSIRLLQVWPEIVGDFIAAHSTPESLKQRVLVVRVLQSTLRFELERSLKPGIIRQVNATLGEGTVREIRFLLG